MTIAPDEPVGPPQEPVQVFDDVWYRSAPAGWRNFELLAHQDIGRLIVGPHGLDFQGRRGRLVIPAIRRLEYGRQGRDFINKWVKVEFGDGPETRTAFFADGGAMGWSGVFGGTKRLLRTIERLVVVPQAQDGPGQRR